MYFTITKLNLFFIRFDDLYSSSRFTLDSVSCLGVLSALSAQGLAEEASVVDKEEEVQEAEVEAAITASIVASLVIGNESAAKDATEAELEVAAVGSADVLRDSVEVVDLVEVAGAVLEVC